MNRWERAVCVFAGLYLLIYAPIFVKLMTEDSGNFQSLIPFHIFGAILNLACIVVVIRDIYKRSFPDPNSKVNWALACLFIPIFGVIIYLFKYGFRPRTNDLLDSPQEELGCVNCYLTGREVRICKFALVYAAIYLPLFVGLIVFIALPENTITLDLWFKNIILPLHLLCMGLIMASYVVIFRNLYKRTFPNPNSKINWALLTLLLPIPFLIIYYKKYCVKPQSDSLHKEVGDEHA